MSVYGTPQWDDRGHGSDRERGQDHGYAYDRDQPNSTGGPGQVSLGQVPPGQAPPGQPGPGQLAPGQPAPGQVAPGQPAAGQPPMGQPQSSPYGPPLGTPSPAYSTGPYGQVPTYSQGQPYGQAPTAGHSASHTQGPPVGQGGPYGQSATHGQSHGPGPAHGPGQGQGQGQGQSQGQGANHGQGPGHGQSASHGQGHTPSHGQGPTYGQGGYGQPGAYGQTAPSRYGAPAPGGSNPGGPNPGGPNPGGPGQGGSSGGPGSPAHQGPGGGGYQGGNPGGHHPGPSPSPAYRSAPRQGEDNGDADSPFANDDDYDAPRSHRHGEPVSRPGGHGHSHGTERGEVNVSARTKRLVIGVLVPLAIATVIATIFLWPSGVKPVVAPDNTGGQRAYGTVQQVDQVDCGASAVDPTAPTGTQQGPCGTAVVRITEGTGVNSNVTVDLPQGPGSPTLAAGDSVVLVYTPDAASGSNAYQVVDHQRGKQIIYMLALCAAIVIAFGRWRGLLAMVGLAISFTVLLVFIIPGILNGEPPLIVAIVGAALIMFAVLYLTHGLNTATSVAIMGTLMSLILVGLLSAGFTAALKLTGYGSEESLYLTVLTGRVDVRGLMLAGMVIGALGVLYDVTVTQAITVEELAQGTASRSELYRSAARIGRAHIASAVNTIVLAYAGTSLPLLLLIIAGGRDVHDLLTSEFLTQEILRSAVGTIGLVAAVPITTGLATLVADLRLGKARIHRH